MTWLEKMDAVLQCLFDHSGDNPKFTDLIEWLKCKGIHKGEIEDITLYLWREGMMYCERNGLRTADYNDRDENAHYLISCEGKLFLEGVGGFKQKKINDDVENTRVEKLEKNQMEYQRNVVWLTLILALGTGVAAVYYFLGVYDNHPQIAYYLGGVLTSIIIALILWSIFRKGNK